MSVTSVCLQADVERSLEEICAAEAVADLVRLRDSIAEKVPTTAARTAQNPIVRTENLCRFPLMGRNIDHAPDSGTLREMVCGNYVVRYSIHADAIAILRIWHHFETRD